MTATTAASGRELARGVLSEARDGAIVLSIPDTEYRLLLLVDGPLRASVGERIAGVIRAQATRVDAIRSGGLYVEPVFGRPRRVQGRIIGTDSRAGAITVNAGVPIVARLGDLQEPSQFASGDLVSFDVEPGATFSPAAG